MDETKTYRIPLEETLGYETVGEVIDGYSYSLLQIGYYMVYCSLDKDLAEYEIQFRKSH
jgi:hypothetical protein